MAIPAAVLCVLLIAGSCAPPRPEPNSALMDPRILHWVSLLHTLGSYSQETGRFPESKEALIAYCSGTFCGTIDWAAFDISQADANSIELLDIASGATLRVSPPLSSDIPEDVKDAIEELVHKCPERPGDKGH